MDRNNIEVMERRRALLRALSQRRNFRQDKLVERAIDTMTLDMMKRGIPPPPKKKLIFLK